ncbi:hypothetical protein ACOMHN_004777 [Nucella lapillus]
MDFGSRAYTPTSTFTLPSTLPPASSPTPFSPPMDVSEYLERKNVEFVTSLIPTLCYIVVLMLCGLAGNCVVFVVYYRRFKPSVTRTYIVAMSVCDLLTNLLSLPADMVEVRFHNTFQQPWLCKSFRTVKSFLSFLSACVLVAVALDRYHTICNPRSKPTRTQTIYIILAASGVLALVVTSPYTVLTGRHTLRYADTNITGSRCSIDDSYVQSRFLFVYNVITGGVFVVCMVLMIVSYARIARQLWLHKKNTTITGRAVGDSATSRATPLTHTYIDEETCVDGLSTDVRDSDDDTDHSEEAGDGSADNPTDVFTISGSSIALALQDYTSKAHPTEDPATARINPGFKSTTSTRTVTIANGRDLPTTTLTPCKMKHSYSDSRLNHAALPNSRAKQSGQGSLLSRIRRTASDAKSFVTRKKSVSKARGSVKKIPTRTTFMMFVLTVIFIVNYLPYLLLVSLRSRMGLDALVGTLGLNGYHISLRSYFLNSAVNPLVYSFCSARFRQECRRLFHCKRP